MKWKAPDDPERNGAHQTRETQVAPLTF